MVKRQNCQIASLIKVSILNATHREAVRPVAAVHAGTAAIEVQESGVDTIYHTRPIAAVATHIVERTIGESAVACHGQLKRRGKSAVCIIAAPASTFGFPF